jgi:heat-inducible transcriptional repressor
MRDTLNERGKQILEAIIEDYISTAEPVGSRTITRRHGISLSPATVRNVMSDLEELGYLASPHTSAGRVPTEKAYRLYVDSLLRVRGVSRDEEDEIRRHCSLTGKDLASSLKEVSRMLSSLSHYMGIVAAPRLAANVYRHLEFLQLGGQRLLAILVTESGVVQNKIIQVSEPIDAEDLIRMANYLNRLLKGLTLGQVRSRILQEMQDEKTRYDALLTQALRLSQETLADDESEVFVEGHTTIIEQPEFADIGRMKEIFRAFEEKGQLLNLLDRCMAAPGVQIFIGEESHLSRMAGMSLITSTFVTGRNTLGVLGVVGPTRMGYAKVIPIVDYTARLVSRIMELD